LRDLNMLAAHGGGTPSCVLPMPAVSIRAGGSPVADFVAHAQGGFLKPAEIKCGASCAASLHERMFGVDQAMARRLSPLAGWLEHQLTDVTLTVFDRGARNAPVLALTGATSDGRLAGLAYTTGHACSR
jgi:hypothetical protein